MAFERDNGNVHRAAAKIIVFKSRAARGSVCNVLLFRRVSHHCFKFVDGAILATVMYRGMAVRANRD